jgi:hypothetical protein
VADLSPGAQAVLDAYGGEVGGTAAITSYERRGVAAALRAAADHLGSCNASTELLAIATELEGQSPELAPDSAYEKAAQLFSKIMYSPAHPELRPTHDEGIHG